MFNISQYLEKFKNLRNSKEAENKIILDTLSERANVKVATKDISIQNGKLSVSAHPLIKSQLQMKKAIILKEISEKLKKNITDLY